MGIGRAEASDFTIATTFATDAGGKTNRVRVLNRVLFVELAMGAVWGELQNVRYHRAGSKRAEDVAGLYLA